MVQDHSKPNDELKQRNAAEHLSTLSGAAFDKAYMSHMVEDHEKDVKEFDKASTSAEDSDLRSWAAKTLPTLQEHLRIAKEIARKL